jgi:hypothetical protein
MGKLQKKKKGTGNREQIRNFSSKFKAQLQDPLDDQYQLKVVDS